MKRIRVPNVPVQMYKAIVKQSQKNKRTISEEVLAIIDEGLRLEKLGVLRAPKPGDNRLAKKRR